MEATQGKKDACQGARGEVNCLQRNDMQMGPKGQCLTKKSFDIKSPVCKRLSHTRKHSSNTMRTQLILTTAVLSVAGSLGASAQVYSVNAVGYINVTVPANKFALVANQLNAGGNKIGEVIPTAAEGTIVFRYAAGAGFVGNGYEFGAWSIADMSLAPGVGFFVQNTTAAAQTLTFVGEVPQGNLSTALSAGLNLTGSQVPQAGKLEADLKYTAAEGDIVYQWDLAGQKYKAPNGYEFGAWSLGEPTVAVAEGFFVQKGAASSWNRTFSVN